MHCERTTLNGVSSLVDKVYYRW